MAESLRKRLENKREDAKARGRSDKYLPFITTVIILIVTFFLGFVFGLIVGMWF